MTRAVPNIFAALTNPQETNLDADFAALAPTVIQPCTVAGTNTLTLTPVASELSVSAYTDKELYSFIAGATSTGAMQMLITGLGTVTLFLQDGTTQANSGDIINGVYYVVNYQSAVGGFVLYGGTSLPGVRLAGVTQSFITLAGDGAGSAGHIVLNSTSGGPSFGAGLGGIAYRKTGETWADPAWVFRGRGYAFENESPQWCAIINFSGLGVGVHSTDGSPTINNRLHVRNGGIQIDNDPTGADFVTLSYAAPTLNSNKPFAVSLASNATLGLTAQNTTASGAGIAAVIADNGTAVGRLLQTSTGYTPAGIVAADQTLVTAGGTGGMTLATLTAKSLTIATNSSQAATWDSSGNMYQLTMGTTVTAANMFVDTSSTPKNQILRSTSSIQYKQDVQPLADPGAMFDALNPVWFRSKASADDPNKPFIGFIAEEVAAAHPALVTLSDGTPNNVDDRAILAVVVAEVKRLKTRIAELEEDKYNKTIN